MWRKESTRIEAASTRTDTPRRCDTMLSFFKKTPQQFEELANLNVESYKGLFAQIQSNLSHIDSMAAREAWLKLTIQRLAENLKWRLQRGYPNQMDRALGDRYRKEARRLLRRAYQEATKSGDGGMDGFSKHAADALASCYLMAESLYFEHPCPIDLFQQHWRQKEILSEINSMLGECDLKGVGCTLPL